MGNEVPMNILRLGMSFLAIRGVKERTTSSVAATERRLSAVRKVPPNTVLVLQHPSGPGHREINAFGGCVIAGTDSLVLH